MAPSHLHHHTGAAAAAAGRRGTTKAYGGKPGDPGGAEGGEDAAQKSGRMRVKGRLLLESMAFQGIIGGLVCFNTLTMGVEAEKPDWTFLWTPLEHLFTAAFFVEMCLKIIVLRREYFLDRWNLLDFMLVWMSVLDTWVLASMMAGGEGGGPDLQSLSVLRSMRMVRLVRVLKLAKQCTRIVIIINGVVDAIRTTLWVALLLFGAIYVCAIFCVDFIGRPTDPNLYPGYSTDPSDYDDLEVISQFNPHLSFGSLPLSMLTLFNIAILAEWGEVIRPIAVKQPELVFFFIVFVLFITFGVMNVIIGLIVDNVMENARNMQNNEQQESQARRRKLVEVIKREFLTMDGDGTGYISVSEMSASAHDKDGMLHRLMNQMGVRFDFDGEELFSILDADGDGKINADEFCTNFYHLVSADVFKLVCMVQMSVNQLKSMVQKQGWKIDKMEACEIFRGPHDRATDKFSDKMSSDRYDKYEKCGASSSCELRPNVSLPLASDLPPAEHGIAATEESLEASKPCKASASTAVPPLEQNVNVSTVDKAAASSSAGYSADPRTAPFSYNEPLLDNDEACTTAAGTECQELLDAKGLELEIRIGRALHKLRRVDEERQMDEKNRRQLEELSGCLDVVRLEVEDAIQSKVRETLAGCLGAVRRAMEDSAVSRGEDTGARSSAGSGGPTPPAACDAGPVAARREVQAPLHSKSPRSSEAPALQNQLPLEHQPILPGVADKVSSRPSPQKELPPGFPHQSLPTTIDARNLKQTL